MNYSAILTGIGAQVLTGFLITIPITAAYAEYSQKTLIKVPIIIIIVVAISTIIAGFITAKNAPDAPFLNTVYFSILSSIIFGVPNKYFLDSPSIIFIVFPFMALLATLGAFIGNKKLTCR